VLTCANRTAHLLQSCAELPVQRAAEPTRFAQTAAQDAGRRKSGFIAP
jgi:hypothetical protein